MTPFAGGGGISWWHAVYSLLELRFTVLSHSLRFRNISEFGRGVGFLTAARFFDLSYSRFVGFAHL